MASLDKRLEYISIPFPTDAITIGQMRQRESEVLDDVVARPGDIAAIEPLAAHKLELFLAQKAFAKANGQPDPHPDLRRGEIVLLLHGVYTRFNLTSGLASTREMLRRVERAAEAQVSEPRR